MNQQDYMFVMEGVSELNEKLDKILKLLKKDKKNENKKTSN